jgi:plastocyanin
MKLFRVLSLLLLSVLLAGVVVACGDDDDEGNGNEPTVSRPAATEDEDEETPDATDEDSATPTSEATGGGLDDEVQVEASDFAFDPDIISVPAGVPVRIEVANTGSARHTLTLYEDEEYVTPLAGADTGQIEGGEDGEVTVTFEEGDYFFRCENHTEQMEGDITAE